MNILFVKFQWAVILRCVIHFPLSLSSAFSLSRRGAYSKLDSTSDSPFHKAAPPPSAQSPSTPSSSSAAISPTSPSDATMVSCSSSNNRVTVYPRERELIDDHMEAYWGKAKHCSSSNSYDLLFTTLLNCTAL